MSNPNQAGTAVVGGLVAALALAASPGQAALLAYNHNFNGETPGAFDGDASGLGVTSTNPLNIVVKTPGNNALAMQTNALGSLSATMTLAAPTDAAGVTFDLVRMGFSPTGVTNLVIGALDSFNNVVDSEVVTFNADGIIKSISLSGADITKVTIGGGATSPSRLFNYEADRISYTGILPDPGPQPVSGPGALALFGVGLLGLGMVRRRDKIAVPGENVSLKMA